jgi:hypothetical protein
MEDKILEEQDKKFRQVMSILALLPKNEPKTTGFFSARFIYPN